MGEDQPAISDELGEGQSKAKPAAAWMHLDAVLLRCAGCAKASASPAASREAALLYFGGSWLVGRGWVRIWELATCEHVFIWGNGCLETGCSEGMFCAWAAFLFKLRLLKLF